MAKKNDERNFYSQIGKHISKLQEIAEWETRWESLNLRGTGQIPIEGSVSGLIWFFKCFKSGILNQWENDKLGNN